jgi:transcriptional regulator with XRE-family HTH domain
MDEFQAERLGARLYRVRLERGLSLRQAAAQTRVTKETISDLEHARRQPHPPTLAKIAAGYGVEISDLLGPLEEPAPKAAAPSTSGLPRGGYRRGSFEPPLEDALADERHLRPWVRYVVRRVEWCERVMQKRPEEEWNNPWLSLDAAIQWAIYVGVEYAALRDAVRAYADGDSEEAVELHALLDRFRAVDEQTSRRVKQMMEEADLNEEQQEQMRLRLVDGDAGAA